MTLAASFLGGASGRLLPASITFRFFGAAAAFHVAAWLVLLLTAEQLIRYRGGLSPAVSALHLLVLGVLVTTAVGSAAQLLPVATRRALAAHWPVRLVFWMLIPGITLMCISMFFVKTRLVAAGAVLTAAGLLTFALILADNLRRAGSLPVVAAFGWAALAALVATALLGAALSLDYLTHVLDQHQVYARAHAIVAGYGFMGMLALGFSHVLVPMFALSPAPGRRAAFAGFVAAVGAVVLAAIGVIGDLPGIVTVASVLGLGAVALHLTLMVRSLKAGMRRRLGLSFILVRAAWIALPASILAGFAAYYGHAGPNGPALFGLLLLVGWLLTFLLGILQRILPFLATMHASSARSGTPARVSELASDSPLKLHAVCHAAAFGLLVFAIVRDEPGPAVLAAWIGLTGSLAFAFFAANVIRGLLPSPHTPAISHQDAR